MILHIYFAKRFLWQFFGTLVIFVAFLTLIDLVEQMRRFDSDVVGFSGILEMTLLNAPAAIYQILPLVMILSSVSLFLTLARSSELVVTRAVGRSAIAMLVSPVTTSLLIGIVAVAVVNPLVAATSKRFLQLEAQYKNEQDNAVSIGREGLWLRQGDETGRTVIHARAMKQRLTQLLDVTFLNYNIVGDPTTRIVANSAQLTDAGWVLSDAKIWQIASDDNPEETAKRVPIMTLKTSLTPDKIRDRFSSPAVVPIWDLPRHIAELEQAGFSPRRHEVWLQMELARPLFLMAMVLVGAGFTMRHTRFGKTGVAVLAAIMLGFGLYYVRNFAQILGENGQLPMLVAAWTPPIASILLALGLLLHMEDG